MGLLLSGAVEVSCGICGLLDVCAGSSAIGESAIGETTLWDGFETALLFVRLVGLVQTERGGT